MSFLVKRSNGYYDLRIKVPADLADKLGSSDLSVGLGIKSKRKARRLLPVYRDRYAQCFNLMRESGTMGKTLNQAVIRDLVRRYVKNQLELQTFYNAVAKPMNDDKSLDNLE